MSRTCFGIFLFIFCTGLVQTSHPNPWHNLDAICRRNIFLKHPYECYKYFRRAYYHDQNFFNEKPWINLEGKGYNSQINKYAWHNMRVIPLIPNRNLKSSRQVSVSSWPFQNNIFNSVSDDKDINSNHKSVALDKKTLFENIEELVNQNAEVVFTPKTKSLLSMNSENALPKIEMKSSELSNPITDKPKVEELITNENTSKVNDKLFDTDDEDEFVTIQNNNIDLNNNTKMGELEDSFELKENANRIKEELVESTTKLEELIGTTKINMEMLTNSKSINSISEILENTIITNNEISPSEFPNDTDLNKMDENSNIDERNRNLNAESQMSETRLPTDNLNSKSERSTQENRKLYADDKSSETQKTIDKVYHVIGKITQEITTETMESENILENEPDKTEKPVRDLMKEESLESTESLMIDSTIESKISSKNTREIKEFLVGSEETSKESKEKTKPITHATDSPSKTNKHTLNRTNELERQTTELERQTKENEFDRTETSIEERNIKFEEMIEHSKLVTEESTIGNSNFITEEPVTELHKEKNYKETLTDFTKSTEDLKTESENLTSYSKDFRIMEEIKTTELESSKPKHTAEVKYGSILQTSTLENNETETATHASSKQIKMLTGFSTTASVEIRAKSETTSEVTISAPTAEITTDSGTTNEVTISTSMSETSTGSGTTTAITIPNGLAEIITDSVVTTEVTKSTVLVNTSFDTGTTNEIKTSTALAKTNIDTGTTTEVTASNASNETSYLSADSEITTEEIVSTTSAETSYLNTDSGISSEEIASTVLTEIHHRSTDSGITNAVTTSTPESRKRSTTKTTETATNPEIEETTEHLNEPTEEDIDKYNIQGTASKENLEVIGMSTTKTVRAVVSVIFLVVALIATVVLAIYMIRTRRKTVVYDQLTLLP